jgi:hypothetical protein
MLALAELVDTAEARSEMTNDIEKLDCISHGIRSPDSMEIFAHMVSCRTPTSWDEAHPLDGGLGLLVLVSQYGELAPDMANPFGRC